jgi:hypothetical protein
MTRETIVRWVLRAYPETLRQAYGLEMLATLLDASNGSARAFIREAFDLLRAGLRSRSRTIADAGLGRLVADGVCLAGVMWMAMSICTLFRFQSPRWQFWLLAVAISLALIGYDRLAGIVGLAQIALVTASQLHNLGATPFRLVVGWHLGAAAFLSVMVLAPRARKHDLRAFLWLAPLAAVAYASSLDPGALIIASIAFIAVSIVGLASLPTDPRLAIAAASVWTLIGIQHDLMLALGGGVGGSPLWVALTAPGPIVVALAAARVRHVRLNVPA